MYKSVPSSQYRTGYPSLPCICLGIVSFGVEKFKSQRIAYFEMHWGAMLTFLLSFPDTPATHGKIMLISLFFSSFSATLGSFCGFDESLVWIDTCFAIVDTIWLCRVLTSSTLCSAFFNVYWTVQEGQITSCNILLCQRYL